MNPRLREANEQLIDAQNKLANAKKEVDEAKKKIENELKRRDMQKAADEVYMAYESFNNAGFSKAQAFKIVMRMIDNATLLTNCHIRL